MNQLELRDIHLPDASLWWPPAPGWWLLLVLVVALLLVMPVLYRWVRHKTLKKRSITAFSQIKQQYQAHADQRRLIADLSILLRRIVMAYRGRAQVAGLTGHDWIMRLTELVEAPYFDEAQLQLLSRGQYARDIDIDDSALLKSCERWINALPRSGPHVPV